MLGRKSYWLWLNLVSFGRICMAQLISLLEVVLFVSRTRPVLSILKVNFNLLRTLIVALITFPWILLSICQLLFVVLMGS